MQQYTRDQVYEFLNTFLYDQGLRFRDPKDKIFGLLDKMYPPPSSHQGEVVKDSGIWNEAIEAGRKYQSQVGRFGGDKNTCIAVYADGYIDGKLSQPAPPTPVDQSFDDAMEAEMDKLPNKPHSLENEYNSGQLDGFELGANWARQYLASIPPADGPWKLQRQHRNEDDDILWIINGDLHLWMDDFNYDVYPDTPQHFVNFLNSNEIKLSLPWTDTSHHIISHLEEQVKELTDVLEDKLIGPEGDKYNASDAYHEIGRMLLGGQSGSVIESVQSLQDEVHELRARAAAAEQRAYTSDLKLERSLKELQENNPAISVWKEIEEELIECYEDYPAMNAEQDARKKIDEWKAKSKQELQGRKGLRWIKASERLPKHLDSPQIHYRLDGCHKVLGNFYDTEDGEIVFGVIGVTHPDYDIHRDKWSGIEWLEESDSPAPEQVDPVDFADWLVTDGHINPARGPMICMSELFEKYTASLQNKQG